MQVCHSAGMWRSLNILNYLIYPHVRSHSKENAEQCGASFSLFSFKNQEAFNFLDLMESQLKEKRKISPSIC